MAAHYGFHLLAVGLICLHISPAWCDEPAAEDANKAFRPPAAPLVTHDPYFSIWSTSDRLSDSFPCHWTGKRQSLASMVRIDGKAYRLMGTEPSDVPPLPQTSLEVLPTRTIYVFQNELARVTLTFMTPALPQDLDILARPVTYLTWEVVSLDANPHAVAIYYDASGELAVNTPEQQIVWSREQLEDLAVLRIGSKDQPILVKKGDNLRIDWGYVYTAVPQEPSLQWAVASAAAARGAFAAGRALPAADDPRMPRAVNDDWPVMAFALDLGSVARQPVARYVLLAYDDLVGLQYFDRQLLSYWRRNGAGYRGLLKSAAHDYVDLVRQCRAFDDELLADLTFAGGVKYTRLAALAYRQCLAANKLVADAKGQPLLFPKENFSNGCIGTVDVIYPMAPLFLLFSPALSKAMLVPVLDYAVSPRWQFPFAPHDLGKYPHATGQVYGGGEKTEKNQMPVEESGNMLLLLAAVAQVDGDAEFAARYWPALSRWAKYLEEKGLDPENQLCTDDFAGHLAHNVNLSGKAILALGAYAKLCSMLGKEKEADAYRATAEQFARKWAELAADGDHYRLAFDKPGTWSQKYNLVWDRLLGLNLFPAEVVRKEMAFYRQVQNRYGLPLDNRQAYTKLDWILWTATLSGSRADFDALVAPVYDFLQQSPSRVPMTDWYWTTNAEMRHFQARPVVGGVFIKLLDDSRMWKKWSDRGAKTSGPWAPLPLNGAGS